MASDLQDLVERAANAPAASAADVEEIMRRAQRLRRRSLTRRVVGASLVAALTAALWVSFARTGDDSSVHIDPASSLLRRPARGEVSAQALADGSPVWVVRHDDGKVSVLSARSTHTPFGVSQLVGWCASSRGFEDGMYGSRWDELGHKSGGPAPSDLASAEVKVVGDGDIKVGPLIAAGVRTPAELNSGPACYFNRPRGYDPGNTERFEFSDDEATSFPDLRRQTTDHPSARFVFVNDAVVVVTQSGPARLCAATRPQRASTCTNGIPIADFDPALFRTRYPNQAAVIRGDLLLRPGRNAVRELTYTNGYKVTTTDAPS